MDNSPTPAKSKYEAKTLYKFEAVPRLNCEGFGVFLGSGREVAHAWAFTDGEVVTEGPDPTVGDEGSSESVR